MKMRRAAIDSILAFIVIFLFFFQMLYLVVGYGSAIKVTSYLDIVSAQGARTLGIDGNTSALIQTANAVAPDLIATVTAGDLTCAYTAGGSRMITFAAEVTLDAPIFGSIPLRSSAASYNEAADQEGNCTLILTTN